MSITSKIKENFSLVVAFIAIMFFMNFHAHSEMSNLIGFLAIFIVIIYSSINVAHHAEALAEKYGEPYGTLILTISAVAVEVLIIAVLMVSEHSNTLARDTIYSAIMIDMNGILALSAIIGGIKYGEQKYNVDSSNSYIAMIAVAIGISMILPYFIPSIHMTKYVIFLVAICLVMYAVFTRIQTGKHAYFFEYQKEEDETKSHKSINVLYHATILFISIAAIGFLSEVMSEFMSETLKANTLPMGLGAVVVAIISASPELLTAIRSAGNNKMQTVVNIAMGATLSTVLLTIPAVLVVGMVMGMHVDLRLETYQIVLISLTLFSSVIVFSDGETNVLEGFIHIVLFATFVFFSFIQ